MTVVPVFGRHQPTLQGSQLSGAGEAFDMICSCFLMAVPCRLVASRVWVRWVYAVSRTGRGMFEPAH